MPTIFEYGLLLPHTEHLSTAHLSGIVSSLDDFRIVLILPEHLGYIQ